VATEEQHIERRREAERQAREARSQAARDAGHPEWADLPQNRSVARSLGVPRYFTGKACPEGHVAPKVTRSQKCEACAAVRKPVGRPRQRPVETRTRWERKFQQAANLTVHNGKLHHVRRNGCIYSTDQKVEGDPTEAFLVAARRTDATGRLHCVIYRSGRFLVRTVAD
jgi:hypothetical protein